jgi:hypothetical protein
MYISLSYIKFPKYINPQLEYHQYQGFSDIFVPLYLV